MPRLRDVSYTRVIKLLQTIGYRKDRQSGSHIIMKAALFQSRTDQDELTVVADNPLALGTLLSILKRASDQTGIELESLKQMLEDL